MHYNHAIAMRRAISLAFGAIMLLALHSGARAQGVTTAALNGFVTAENGDAIPGAIVVALHEPSGTRYGATTRANGQFNIFNMRVGGPYTVTASHLGYKKQSQSNVFLSLGQDLRVDFKIVEETIVGEEVVAIAERDEVLNSGRTGAETAVSPLQVTSLPSIKRSTRDLTRLDPRSDGNFSFGGRNWLYNNISLDGSYFNNPFGLDDPAPGGQANAEPIPYDAVEQVQVSIAPFDVTQGGFTGAGINTVTRSGTNQVRGSVYSFLRNESLLGNKVKGKEVVAKPDLSFNQSGVTVSGPIIPNTLFFFLNGELERRDDPGTNFAANRGQSGFGISRVRASALDSIRTRMMTVYGYDPGPYEGYINKTKNEKWLLKLDWNVDENNNATLRYSYLNARRELPPHPFVLSFAGTGRGPNENSLPFRNAGYRINNHLNSIAVELNSHFDRFANRFFASYNRFRDNRDPFSKPFPTVEIGEGGINYTTLGHEPFSIHNILDQDVWQVTNNISYYAANHVITVGANFEKFSFFNSFNIFRHGVFFLPYQLTFLGATTFPSLAEFFTATDPTNPNWINFNSYVGTGPFKGENIDVGQLAIYAQDEFQISEQFKLTFGLRVDFPMYFTDPVDNPFSRQLKLADENGNPETLDQSKLAGTQALFSPRAGFNWDVSGDRTTQLRGGTGIFTGRIPFVWIGNVISNPGPNPKLFPTAAPISTKKGAVLQQSFDMNAMVPDFKWPQIWTTNLAVDQKLPWDLLGTIELIYGKDINAIFVRNADLGAPIRTLPDGRPFYGGAKRNPFAIVSGDTIQFPGGVYVIDNTNEGWNFNATAQLRKKFDFGLNAGLAYSFLVAKSVMKSTEIASVLFAENPVKGDPNKPVLGYSEFGNRHRITGTASYQHQWSDNFATTFGLFIEVAEGNRFVGAGGNRYSFTYSGDVNGDGSASNDLMYVPRDATNPAEIRFADIPGGLTAAQQAQAFEAFIRQDPYLNSRRGQIVDRFGALNPWFSNIDLRILQDLAFIVGGQRHAFQLSVDVLNVANLLNSSWGVRSVATAAATSPLELVGIDPGSGTPFFNFKGSVKETFVDDPGLNSRWQVQLGLRYILN